MAHHARTPDGKDRAHASEAWGDIGATLARIGAPIEVATAQAFDPFEPELPLEGGDGASPSDIESKRHVAAFIRQLYDDVFDYAVDDPVASHADREAPGGDHEGSAADAAPEAPVELQAFDRKTGAPIKVKINRVASSL